MLLVRVQPREFLHTIGFRSSDPRRSGETANTPGSNPGQWGCNSPERQPRAPLDKSTSSRRLVDQDTGVRSRRSQVRILPGAFTNNLRAVAQERARSLGVREVVGANPTGPILPNDMVGVVQPAERPPVKRKVAGASPVAHPNAQVVQPAEHALGKREVAGANPALGFLSRGRYPHFPTTRERTRVS